MSRTLTGWSFWGTRGSRGTEAPARQPGTRVNPLQRAGPIRVRAEIPSVTRKRAFLNHAQLLASCPRSRRPPREERSSQRVITERPHPTGGSCPREGHGKGKLIRDSLFRVFRWIPWLISDPSGAAIGCCWTESAVRICADLGCRDNNRQPLSEVVLPFGPELFHHKPIHVAEADLLQ